MMLPEVHCHALLPMHLHLRPSPSAALQLHYGLCMMLPEVHLYILLPVRLHLHPSLSVALQWSH